MCAAIFIQIFPRPAPPFSTGLNSTGFRDRSSEMIRQFLSNIHITKVPSVVPRGAHYGAIQLASKRFVLHQSAMNGHQFGHLLAAQIQTETPTALGFPS